MKNKILVSLLMICSIYTKAQLTPPYFQDFEFGIFPPSGWETFPIGSPINWQHDTTASGHGIGTACISFDNYNTAAGSYYGIRLPPMLFNSVTNPYLRFDIAYAQRTGASSDIFGIWWSNNGSSNWQNIFSYSSGTLTTAPSTANLFVPTPTQWQTKTLSILSLAGLPYVRLAIEDNCNNGNKIYIDNVEVFDSLPNVKVNEVFNANQLMVFPNPATKIINVLNSSSLAIRFLLYNSFGEIVLEKELIEKTTQIDISDYSDGMYFYKLNSESEAIKWGNIIKQ